MADPFEAIRAHVEKHAGKERATFSIAGIEALLDAFDERQPEISTLARAETPDGGIIKLELWPEGYALWYHGQIVWRSWEPAGKTVTAAIVANVDHEAVQKALEAASEREEGSQP